MKKKSPRLVLLLGLLLLVVVLVGGYFLLSGGGGAGIPGLGAPPPTAEAQRISIYVAKQPIPAKMFLSSEVLDASFEPKTVTKTADMGSDVITAKYQIEDRVNLDNLQPGETLRERQFVDASLSYKIPANLRAFPIKVDIYTGVVGEIKKDDYVDVILSGQVEQYFPQEFPLSEECTQPGSTCLTFVQRQFPQSGVEPTTMWTVKTVLEDIQVLKVITLTAEVAPAGGARPTATPGVAALPPGWILILAVDEQQAEVLRFAQEQEWGTQLLLRAVNDHTRSAAPGQNTTGVTTWILLDPEGSYLMPVPQLIPHPIPSGNLPDGVIPGIILVP